MYTNLWIATGALGSRPRVHLTTYAADNKRKAIEGRMVPPDAGFELYDTFETDVNGFSSIIWKTLPRHRSDEYWTKEIDRAMKAVVDDNGYTELLTKSPEEVAADLYDLDSDLSRESTGPKQLVHFVKAYLDARSAAKEYADRMLPPIETFTQKSS